MIRIKVLNTLSSNLKLAPRKQTGPERGKDRPMGALLPDDVDLSPRGRDLASQPGLSSKILERMRWLDVRLVGGDRVGAGQAPLIIVTSAAERQFFDAALDYDACGTSGGPFAETLCDFLHRLLSGEMFVPSIGSDVPCAEEKAILSRRFDSLTHHQRIVLGHLMKGRLNKQIAHDMAISITTVKAHVTAVIAKLHVVNRVQAVILANRICWDAGAAIAASESKSSPA